MDAIWPIEIRYQSWCDTIFSFASRDLMKSDNCISQSQYKFQKE